MDDSKTCSTCRWWTDASERGVQNVIVPLGHPWPTELVGECRGGAPCRPRDGFGNNVAFAFATTPPECFCGVWKAKDADDA